MIILIFSLLIKNIYLLNFFFSSKKHSFLRYSIKISPCKIHRNLFHYLRKLNFMFKFPQLTFNDTNTRFHILRYTQIHHFIKPSRSQQTRVNQIGTICSSYNKHHFFILVQFCHKLCYNAIHDFTTVLPSSPFRGQCV